MVLVEYSDSEESDSPSTSKDKHLSADNAITSRPHKRQKLGDNAKHDSTAGDGKYNITKSPPPLPSNFHSLYAVNVRTSTTDDPSLHGGRKRQVAHVQGNWPSHIYLEWLPEKPQLQYLNDIIFRVQTLLTATVRDQSAATAATTPTSRNSASATDSSTIPVSTAETDKLHTFLATPLGANLPLHISLSAPLVLTSTTKSAFHNKLTEAIQDARTGQVKTRLSALDLVPNFERSRWFLVARVTDSDGDGVLMKLLTVCNQVCREFGLSVLYQSGSEVGLETKGRSQDKREEIEYHYREGTDDLDVGADTKGGDAANAFHVSIAWTLKAPSIEVREAVRRIQLGELGREAVCFDRVKIKIGNVVDDVIL